MSLTPFNRPVKRKRFTTYDLEWYPGTYKLRLVGVFDRENGYRSYETIEEFLDEEMIPENRGCIYYAHAGGLADIQFVLEAIMLRRQNYEVGTSFSGSSAIIVQVQEKGSKGKPWLFCDSYWLMRDSLDNIGKSLGEGKKTYICPDYPHCGHHEGVPFERDGSPNNMCVFFSPMSILREYNAHDCSILYRAIERLEDELIELGGELMMTIASCALRLFRRAFLKRDIISIPVVNDLANEAYVASRVEVHEHYLPTVFSYDINSSFPYSLTRPQPGNCFGLRRWNENDELALVYAEVYVPSDIRLPPLAKRVNGRVFFPTGQWKGWFSGLDLQFLLQLGGRVVRVWQSYGFEPFDDTRAYVETLYELRRVSTDPFRRIVYKYLLNSLYGKFAEGSEKDQMLLRKPLPKGARLIKSMLDGKALFLLRDVHVAHAIVHISGITTSRSRRVLGEGMLRIGGVGYVDTDSVNSSRPPIEIDSVNGVVHSDKLGEFKWEKEKFVSYEESDLEAAAPKLYRIGDRVKMKGFSRIEGTRRPRREHFDRLISGDPVEIRRMTRVKEVLSEADAAMRSDSPVDFMPHDVDFLKQAALTSRPKRRRLPDGKTTPWDVAELDEAYLDQERLEEVQRRREAFSARKRELGV